MKAICFLLLATLLAVGCATNKRPRPPLLGQADVISLVKAGESDESIMRRIDASGTVFNLSADDIVFLRKEGVSDRLVTFMNDTRTRAAVEEERRRSYYDGRWSYGFGFGHGW